MAFMLPVPLPGTLGARVGAGSDGVLVGAAAATALSKCLTSSHALAALCITDDGGLYVQKTTDFGDADVGDVAPLPATPAVDDACYFGHATAKFTGVDINISTAGAWTLTVEFQYWNGSAWTALAGVTDGTTALTAGTGVKSVTFTEPVDWAKCTVDSVNGYWVRMNVMTYSAVTTQALVTNGNIRASTTGASYTDKTTDANDADAGDVALLPTNPTVNDAVYFGYSSKFFGVKATVSQARTGTATLVCEYWTGSAWSAIPIYYDQTIGWSAAAGTKYITFSPPADWTANTGANGPNGEAGFFIRMRMSAMTSVTQQPLLTRAYVYPLNAGSGQVINEAVTITKVTGNFLTVSGTTTDSSFVVVNKTAGTFALHTQTKAVGFVASTVSLGIAAGAEIIVAQVTHDGSTEFANGSLTLATAN